MGIMGIRLPRIMLMLMHPRVIERSLLTPSVLLQYSGQDVLIIAPDSYALSALQAAALGVDLRQHNSYSMGPGEVSREDSGLFRK